MYYPYVMLLVLNACRHRRLQIRKQAPQSRRRSSAQGLLCLLCALTSNIKSLFLELKCKTTGFLR